MFDEDVPTHYGLNMINQKITFPRDINFSDDELSFLPYFVYFNAIKVQYLREREGRRGREERERGVYEKNENSLKDSIKIDAFAVLSPQHLTAKRLDKIDSKIVQFASLSLERSWRVVARGKSSMWTVIYAYALDKAGDTELIEKLVWTLRSWPLELVMWRTNNSHRLDIRKNPEQDR